MFLTLELVSVTGLSCVSFLFSHSFFFLLENLFYKKILLDCYFLSKILFFFFFFFCFIFSLLYTCKRYTCPLYNYLPQLSSSFSHSQPLTINNPRNLKYHDSKVRGGYFEQIFRRDSMFVGCFVCYARNIRDFKLVERVLKKNINNR